MCEELKKGYTVEQGDAGCKSCGNGKTWFVIDPDGTDIGISYGDRDEAEDMAEELNKAFTFGWDKKSASKF